MFSRCRCKVLSILAVIPIVIASALLPEIVEEFDHRDPSTWTTVTQRNSSGNCMGQDFIQCYENILEYVTLGEEAIKVSDEKKAVIVIGLTRVGKSTLTQFIANETNPLFVSCAGIICQLIDDSGDGGNSVVSKTFVPNTVEDESTNGVLTPFYDMPGFDDTRNISVEIANSFFIQKVINNIEQVKIVVVAKHASFSSTETTFKTLMTFLIKFAKDPTKFGNSIVIISNFGSYADEDAAHFYNMREYMLAYNESMYGAESSHPDPQERETATAWIRCFLDASDDEPDNLRRAAVFRSPGSRLNGKSIRNDSVYQEDSVRMKQLIWNETLFTPINSSDIGFTLSTEAELFLERATRESDTIIRNHLNGFALRIKAHLEGFIQQMKTAPSKEGMKRLQSHFTTLLNVCFWACNSTIASGPRECVNQIENQLSELAAEMDDMIFTDINKTSNYLQFAYENIGKETEYSMEDWIMSMQGLWYDTNTYFNSNTLEVASKVLNSLENFANDVHNFSLIEFEKLVNNQDQGFLQSLNNTVSELLKMEVFRNCSEENPSSSYLSCFKEIVEKTKLLRELTSNNLDIDLQPSVIFLELACSEVELCLGSANWVDSLVSLKKRVVGSLEEQEIPQNTFNVLLTQLTDAAVKVKSEILHDVPNFVSIADLLNHLLFAKDATEEIARSLESYNSSDSLGGYADLVASAYRKLHNNSVEGVILDRIYVLERLKIFSWFGPVWTIFHRDSLTLPILLEWRVSEFQFQLFNNLGATNVQVGDLGDVHRWRLENPNLQSSNFDQFWDSFESIGVDTVRTFREFRQDIKGHISNNEYSRRWLNELLDYTLKRDQSSCPTVDSSRVVKFERKYMTLRFIYDCLKTYSVKPNIIVALAENTFFFDASFENPGISNKYKIFVMSRNFDYTRGQRIDLNGTDGEHPNQKPAKPTTPSANGIAGRKGNDGKEGADFIGVYLTAIGQPSKLDITSQGGRGGDGQDGGDGADSEDTPGPNLGWHNGQDLGNGQCAAWDDYRILVKVYPNNCNFGEGRYCDSGSWVIICGEPPNDPGSAGAGGNYGLGGSGGFKVIVNVTSSAPSVESYPDGSSGIRGKDGNVGKRGTRGAVEVNIGSRYCWSCIEYKCVVSSGLNYDRKCFENLEDEKQNNVSLPALLEDEVQLQFENGRHISEKHSRTLINKRLDYPLQEFKPYVKTLLDNAVKSLNIFNRQELTTYIDFVKSNSLLV